MSVILYIVCHQIFDLIKVYYLIHFIDKEIDAVRSFVEGYTTSS